VVEQDAVGNGLGCDNELVVIEIGDLPGGRNDDISTASFAGRGDYLYMTVHIYNLCVEQ
jgi:hypothetical protein